MNQIKLMFSDFWHKTDPATIQRRNPFYRWLSKKWDIVLTDQPDFLIYSCNGFEYLRHPCIRIFYTGENIRPNFDECDYAFSFDYLDTGRNYRLPLYRLENEYSQIFQPRSPDTVIREKRKFCCFLASNPDCHVRNNFFTRLNEYRQVDSGGTVFNNIGYQVPRRINEKLSWMQGYKFSIVFENSQYPGYTTEKLLHALITNTIPIYWGNPEVAKDFNPAAFLNCNDYPSFEAVIEQIQKIDEDDALYYQYLSQPYLPNNIENFLCKEENILSRFEEIFDQKKSYISASTKIKQKIYDYPKRKIIKQVRKTLGIS